MSGIGFHTQHKKANANNNKRRKPEWVVGEEKTRCEYVSFPYLRFREYF
jgi:hypothetical protein